MRKMMLAGLLIAGTSLSLGGCMSEQTKGVIGGGAAGAVLGGVAGGVIGRHTTGDTAKGARIGAVAGGLLGAVIGERMTRQTEELQQVPGVQQVNYDQQQQKIEAQMQILFDVDKDLVKPAEAVKLDQLAAVFAKYPENIVLIEGHTDSDGSEAYNQSLSNRRARSIENYLRAKNLNIASLNSVGYGESRPVDSNETASGKAHNRRVELKISVDPNRVPQQQGQQPGGAYPAPGGAYPAPVGGAYPAPAGGAYPAPTYPAPSYPAPGGYSYPSR